MNTIRLTAALHSGELDAVFLRPGSAGSEEFQLRLVSEEPIIVVLPASHPAARQG